MNKTLTDAKRYNDKVSLEDVRTWFAKNIGVKRNLRGYNSFIADRCYEEYQMDLFFFQDLEKESGQKQPSALLMVDIFSKYCVVVPTKTKQPDDVLEAIKECIKDHQAKPESIYSDEEGAFVSNKVQSYFRSEEIRHIITRGHAAVAERTGRTIKDLLYRRVDGQDNPIWTDHIKAVLNTYNKKMVHSATGFTPYEGRLAKHRMEIKTRLELNAKRKRKYPNIAIGDKVRLYKKKGPLDKERVGVWSKDLHEVLDITESEGQKFYKIKNRDHLFVRADILLVPN
jgi:hypothetical protein